jgi:hypothetical protein
MTKWPWRVETGSAENDSFGFYVEMNDRPGYEGVNHCPRFAGRKL